MTGTQQLGPCKDDTDTGTVTATGSSTTLSNLRAFTTYTVHVIAVSGFGSMSSQSSPRTFTTSQTGELHSTVPADKRIHKTTAIPPLLIAVNSPALIYQATSSEPVRKTDHSTHIFCLLEKTGTVSQVKVPFLICRYSLIFCKIIAIYF